MLGCQSTSTKREQFNVSMEEQVEIITELDAKPIIMIYPRSKYVESGDWVDFTINLQPKGKNKLQVTNIKLVNASRPKSAQLVNESAKALSKWVYSAKLTDYMNKRYLVRVSAKVK